MDTTYFKGSWWVMVFRLRDPITHSGKNILRYRVEYETNDMYRKWIAEIEEMWVTILGIIWDGRRWLLASLERYNVQMCLFHMQAIIRRNVGKNPILEQHKELKNIAYYLWKIREETRKERFNSFVCRNTERLKEKNENWWYIHEKARRAVRSLRHHMKHLFTYAQVNWMPSTSNSNEWNFSRAKTKNSLHRWKTKKRTRKFIDRYLNET